MCKQEDKQNAFTLMALAEALVGAIAAVRVAVAFAVEGDAASVRAGELVSRTALLSFCEQLKKERQSTRNDCLFFRTGGKTIFCGNLIQFTVTCKGKRPCRQRDLENNQTKKVERKERELIVRYFLTETVLFVGKIFAVIKAITYERVIYATKSICTREFAIRTNSLNISHP